MITTPPRIPTVTEVSVSAGDVLLQDEILGLGRVCVITKGEDGITIHTTMGNTLKFAPGYETKILVRRTS